MTTRLQILTEDYFGLQDEMSIQILKLTILIERLSQARPSDEMAKINIIGRDMEQLLNGLATQRKKTLEGLDTMGKLIDFDAMAHVNKLILLFINDFQNPARKKVGTQTENDF